MTDSNESESELSADSPILPDEERGLTWGDRMLKAQTLSPRHLKLAELIAAGLKNEEIAEQLDYTPSRVSVLRSNTLIKEAAEKIMERLYEESIGKRLKQMEFPALAIIERALTDQTNRIDERLKVETAKWLIEKRDGKAGQTLDVNVQGLGSLLDKLDAMKNAGRTIDVSARSVSSAEQIEAPAQQLPPSEEELLADWVTSFE